MACNHGVGGIVKQKQIFKKTVTLLFFLSLSLSFCINFYASAQSPTTQCFDTFAEADRLFPEPSSRSAAEQLYRQCKPPFQNQELAAYFPDPVTDPEQLSPGSRVYWREAQEGLERDQESRVFTALSLLIEKEPAFMPAYGALAEALQKFEREVDALEILEQAATLFPYNAEIAKDRAAVLRNNDQYLEASMASRLFVMVNPEHPDEQEFLAQANEDFGTFQAELRQQYIAGGILGAVTGVLFGDSNAALDSVGLAMMLVQGESATGAQLAAATREAAQEQGVLIEDPVLLEYVTTIGKDIADQMGRDEFDYEFSVIKDDSLNAFALPGGKVFVNTGAILAAKSEAELAGLMAHEVAHAVLSHGYQKLATDGMLRALSNALPLGGLLGSASLANSRQYEQQADILGTRAIAGFGYAADGLRNLFVTLDETSGSSQAEYLSTHPLPPNRVSYIEALIVRNGYNRYAFEGVEEHARMQQRVRELTNS